MKHKKQIEAFWDKTRHKFILAGRRGGKTTLIVEDICASIPKMPKYSVMFYIGPTNSHAMELMWEPLQEALIRQGFAFNPLVSRNKIMLSNHRTIYIIGAEKIQRIRGHKAWRVYMDEVAFFEKPLVAIMRSVRPTLTDFKGKLRITTTPNGKNTQAYRFYIDILDKPEWKYFSWTTLDNPFIDPKEIEDARRDMDEKSFNQEYLAQWEAFEGLAYYNFNESKHIVECGASLNHECKRLGTCVDVPVSESEYNLSLGKIDLMLDFNVNPTSLITGQEYPNLLQFKREYSLKNSSTEATMIKFCQDHAPLKEKVWLEIFGDAAGSNRSSNTGKADYEYVKAILTQYGFKFKMSVLSKNPHPPDRVSHVNAWLKNLNGESRIQVDPFCKDLIMDLGAQQLEGRYPSDKNNLGHKADAIGYRVFWKQIISKRAKQETVKL